MMFVSPLKHDWKDSCKNDRDHEQSQWTKENYTFPLPLLALRLRMFYFLDEFSESAWRCVFHVVWIISGLGWRRFWLHLDRFARFLRGSTFVKKGPGVEVHVGSNPGRPAFILGECVC